jgi:hypothetical protein
VLFRLRYPFLYPWRGIQNISSRTIFCLTHDKRIFRLDEKNKKVFLKTAFCPLQIKVMSGGHNDMQCLNKRGRYGKTGASDGNVWFYEQDGEIKGPVSDEKIRRLIKSSVILRYMAGRMGRVAET